MTRRALRQGQKDHTRLRWEATAPNALWHADVCHTAFKRPDGTHQPLQIHALLDDATRFVVARARCPSNCGPQQRDICPALVVTSPRVVAGAAERADL